jgi:hypothetical protein
MNKFQTTRDSFNQPFTSSFAASLYSCSLPVSISQRCRNEREQNGCAKKNNWRAKLSIKKFFHLEKKESLMQRFFYLLIVLFLVVVFYVI